MKLPILFGLVVGVAVRSGVDFDKGGADGGRRFDLIRIGIDKQADRNPSLIHFCYNFGQLLFMPLHVKTAFGGQLLSFFRDQGNHIRLEVKGKIDNLRHDRHFQVELAFHRLSQQSEITVLNVTAILAQVDDNARRPGQLANAGGQYWIGLAAAPGLAQGRHMIDIDGKFDHGVSPFILV